MIIGLWLLSSVFFISTSTTEGATSKSLDSDNLIKVKFHSLTIDPQSKQPVVLLADPNEERALIIWIGFFEARAMHSEMQGIEPFRPLTHDLLKRIIQNSDGTIHHIVITHLKENVYYANIVIERNGSFFEIDARPSDSIVMALKFKAPIYVAKDLFEQMSISIKERAEIEDEYGITLQDLTPSLARYLAYESDRGVLVSNLRKGSRAEKDGIEVGDILVEIDGETIDDALSMKEALSKSKSSLKAKIFRKSKYISITIHPK
ncbi:MAG: bifunctional nuclease family protein [Desulfobacterales bacterium]|nr:MAG: bifunctional nuclease family protein [Desulfobacterales bacterium]